ncbi:NAD-dependent epimerase [Sphingomonas sp. G-3-2-10]|uniref:NAD-dependent epimerase n=1 Tax=Sphingomonas sp. G-3-2-10 TaxID=2728838 RepID=UPI00146C1A20|nr:NAD-dependent epimerase [Sphingomonas sp. G-3-2-10]NML04443.1 NAD-dependent epimerase [Sphingomonas sp. G-3-2-10]
MRFLITGTAGFIGFHLAKRLLADGHQVTGFDGVTDYYDVRLKEARIASLSESQNFRFVKGMLEDASALDRAADLAEPDIIVHLAAQAGVRYSIEAPRTYVDSNLVGSFNVLELARRIQPKHLMLASTSSVYGANEDMPFGENQRTDTQMSLYAATKKSMEGMAHSYSHLFGVPTTAFRFFTVYGPYGRPDMALFKFVSATLKGEPIDVYGHGKMARDFTYVSDLVEAITRLADVVPNESNRVAGIDSLSPVAPYRVVNIAGGQPTPLMEFIETMEEALGIKARLNMMEMQAGDVPATSADPSLLKALTGYIPGTTVREGVFAFVKWYRAHYGK